MIVTSSRRAPAVVVLVLCLLTSVISCSSAPSDPLAQWRTALRQQSSAPASWVAIGDSITEGQGASSRDARWVEQTRDGLRTNAGGEGYSPGWYAVYGPDSPWEPYSSREGDVADEEFGSLGLRTATLQTGATQTYEVTGTSAYVYYLTNGGVLGISIDDTPVTTIDTAGPYSTANRYQVTFAGPGPHSLTVYAVTGPAYVAGVEKFQGDEANGVRLYDHAHSGFTSGQFVAAQDELNPVLALLQPDLVTIELGVNDYLTGDPGLPEVRGNLQELVDNLREELTEKPPSIVIVLPYRIGPEPRGDYSWDDYTEAVTALGEELSVGVLDMSSMGTSEPGGYWSSDALHPSDEGHREMARLATAYLRAS